MPRAILRAALVACLVSTAGPVLSQTVADGIAAAQAGDPAAAIAIFRPLAEAGDPVAQYWLAESYWGGWWGGVEDLAARALWHGRAAAQGHAPSMVELGHMHALGHHLPQDDAAAARLYAQAARLGNADALHALGNAYAAGTGVPQDAANAHSLWRQAADRGHEGARLALCAVSADICPPP